MHRSTLLSLFQVFVVAIISVWGLSKASAEINGIIVRSDYSGSPLYPTEFSEISWKNGLTGILKDPKGRRISFENHFVHRIIYFKLRYFETINSDARIYPMRVPIRTKELVVDLEPQNLINDSETEKVTRDIAALESASRLVPKSKAVFSTRIDELRAQLSRFSRGEKKVDGKWMSASDYNSSVSKVARRREATTFSFKTKDGTTHEGIEISSLKERSFSVVQDSGIVEIPFDCLPDDIKNLPSDLRSSVQKWRDEVPARKARIQQAIENLKQEEIVLTAQLKALDLNLPSQDELKAIENASGKTIDFIVQRKLSFTSFRVLEGVGNEIYEVRIPGAGLAILATKETSFESNGRASLKVTFMEKVPVEMGNGFEKNVPVFVEVDSTALRQRDESQKNLSRIQASKKELTVIKQKREKLIADLVKEGGAPEPVRRNNENREPEKSVEVKVTSGSGYSIIEYKIPTGDNGVGGIAIGSDGNLWFTNPDTHKIGRLTPEGILSEYKTPTQESRPEGITCGPDGNIWFTEDAAIGRITPDGIITEFKSIDGKVEPTAIVTGPDGNLWFTDMRARKIGKISPEGVITEIIALAEDRPPVGIAVGPDGNIWITEAEFVSNRTGYIARLTSEGILTEFPLPSPNCGPEQIAAGSDGNLWFTEGLGNKIGRITPTGEITEFSIPTPNSQPRGIALARDGNLWFTESNVLLDSSGVSNSSSFVSKIGRITPAGGITEIVIPNTEDYWRQSIFGSREIASDNKGNIWFTEGINRIGRLDISKDCN